MEETGANYIIFREENRETLYAFFNNLLKFSRSQFTVRFDDDFAGFGIDNII